MNSEVLVLVSFKLTQGGAGDYELSCQVKTPFEGWRSLEVSPCFFIYWNLKNRIPNWNHALCLFRLRLDINRWIRIRSSWVWRKTALNTQCGVRSPLIEKSLQSTLLHLTRDLRPSNLMENLDQRQPDTGNNSNWIPGTRKVFGPQYKTDIALFI